MDFDTKLQGFQLIAQEKLQNVLCSIPGKKDLVLEQSLIKPLEHICSASWLRLKGIHRIFKFDEQNAIPARASADVQVFMVQCKVQRFRMILSHIQTETDKHKPASDAASIKHYHIVCVPSCFAYFSTMLEEDGLYGIVQLHQYNWDFIYLDTNVLSMELPNLFPALFMEGDSSLLPAVAQSLRVLQMVTGQPEVVLTFGDHSESVYKILQTLGPWPQQCDSHDEELTALLIIDRDKDYTSGLLTPAIYAGLLLEVFQQRAGEVINDPQSNRILQQKLPIFLLPHKSSTQTAQRAPPQKPSVLRLNAASDEIYAENRYKHFAQASSAVRCQAKAIGVEVQKLNAMKLEEIHDYVARKLQKITELKMKVTRHLHASEKIIEMLGANYRKVQALEEDILNNVSRKRILSDIDELLTTEGQRYNTVRLLCLLHHCAGIAADELAPFVRNYCNYFGFRYLPVFQQLANAGLLPHLEEDAKQPNKSAKLLSNLPLPKFQQTEFQANANRLKLLVGSAAADATSHATGDSSSLHACPSSMFNGLYIPLVAQLCSFLLKAGTADDFAAKLGMIEKLQMHLPNASEPQTAKVYANLVRQSQQRDIFPLRQKPNILVFVVGGVTYAEIGACDMVARLTGSTIVVGSDTLICGADLIAGAF